MTSCLLDYNYFNKYYKILAIDSSKQQALHADLKAIQEIYFTGGNLNRDGVVKDNTKMFFIIEGAKETMSDFSQVTVKSISI